MKEMKLRIEDALAATKAAVEEGIVAAAEQVILMLFLLLRLYLKQPKAMKRQVSNCT